MSSQLHILEQSTCCDLLQMRWTICPCCMQGAKAAVAKPPAAAKGKKGKDEDKPLQVCWVAAILGGSQAACNSAWDLSARATKSRPAASGWC